MEPMDSSQRRLKQRLEDIMSHHIPDELDERMERAFDSFREKLSDHPRYQAPASAPVFQWFHGWNMAWSTGFATFLIVLLAVSFLGNQPPTWADVTQQFKSISFFHATVNVRKVNSAQTIQFEFWMGNRGKFRLQCGTQVVFANQEGIQYVFDTHEKTKVEPHDFLTDVIHQINEADQFSLETVLNSFTGNLSDLQLVPSRVEGVSNDISIFDLKPENTNESIRIWALRESMLPIYLKYSDGQDGIMYNAFFSYQQEQPDTFFDAKHFESELNAA